jgi:hypothetical protein
MGADLGESPLCNRISVIPQTSSTILPQVGVGGRKVVESRKNGQFFRGITWWDYLVGSTEFSRPPAHPPVAAPTRAPPRGLNYSLQWGTAERAVQVGGAGGYSACMQPC